MMLCFEDAAFWILGRGVMSSGLSDGAHHLSVTEAQIQGPKAHCTSGPDLKILRQSMKPRRQPAVMDKQD